MCNCTKNKASGYVVTASNGSKSTVGSLGEAITLARSTNGTYSRVKN